MIDIAQLELGFSQTLHGSLAAPAKRLFGILLDALAFQQHHGEIVLRVAVALLGGAAVPFYGLRKIGDDASAGAVHCRQLELRGGVALFGGLAEPQCRCRGVAGNAVAVQIIPCEELLGSEMPASAAAR